MIEDYKKLGIAYLFLILVSVPIFYKEHYFTTVRVVTTFFILFLLPGFIVLYKKPFLERLVFGGLLGSAVIGIISYYIGLLGLNIKYHWALSFIMIGIGLYCEVKNGKSKSGDTEQKIVRGC